MNATSIDQIDISNVNKVVRIKGKIVKVRSLGSIDFLTMAGTFRDLPIVFENPSQRVKRLDMIDVSGKIQNHKGRLELVADTLQILVSPRIRDENTLSPLLHERKRQCLRLRHLLLQTSHHVFSEKGFIPVTSPKIVSEWARGQTPAFPINFYDDNAYLTISNMVYHLMYMNAGYSKIYEITNIFRAERPSSSKRLAEFTILDLGLIGNRDELMASLENIILSFHRESQKLDINGFEIPENIVFERVNYSDILKEVGLQQTTGSQLPKLARDYIKQRYPSFVWILGFPARKRPFFVKSINGTCIDCQLWYKGKIYLAAGGERETETSVMVSKIQAEGKNPSDYDFLLSSYDAGVDMMAGIGMGVERFLATFAGGVAAEYTAFPRYINTITP